MSLSPGARIGIYEIVTPIGTGGMGEVYRGRDTRLGRDVAIKILPEQFATDRDRVARFEREARTLASLNHQHIAQIYGLEHADSTIALVMELVDGDDLSQRIAKGAIPLDESLAIARQIADALDAAHGQGIVHRDLKPANIKLRADGAVKVLDFGLAKPAEDPAASSGATITSPAMSMPGVILGTAAYMAPEQAKGRPVDKRADIWAFGCVVYEMVTGRRAFSGEDVSETIASILRSEPDWTLVPASITPLLVSCLQKDTRKRLRDIGDAMLLSEPSPVAGAPIKRSPSLVPWYIAALAIVAAIAVGVVHFRDRPVMAAAIAFDLQAPAGANFGDSYLAWSPDGRRLAYTLRDNPSAAAGLWVRDVDQRRARPLRGTDNARAPFWSPDGRSIAFVRDSQLLRIDVDAGTGPRLLSDLGSNAGLGSWGPNGTIIIGSRLGGVIYRVPDTGGTAVPITTFIPSRREGFHAMPAFLRDGKRFIYQRTSQDPALHGIYVGSLDLPPDQQPLDRLVETRLGAELYQPAGGPTRLLFIVDGNLMSQEFDESRAALVGAPVLEAERIGSGGSLGFFAVSAGGALAYRHGESGGPNDVNLMWFDRSGKQLSQVLDRGAVSTPKLSPDETKLVFGLSVGSAQRSDIWLSDLTRGVTTRLTTNPEVDAFPVWSPDGSRIIFWSFRNEGHGLYERRIDGIEPERLVLPRDANVVPDSWTPDGRFVLFSEQNKVTGYDISVLQLGASPTVAPLLNSAFNESFGKISPDGRYLAYVSDESGRDEIYVRTFTPPGVAPPANAGKWRISTEGARSPRWRHDGKELLYRTDDQMMSVPIDVSKSTFSPGRAVALFSVRGLYRGVARSPTGGAWDVTADGQRFLLPLMPMSDATEPINVTLNWRPGGQRAQ